MLQKTYVACHLQGLPVTGVKGNYCLSVCNWNYCLSVCNWNKSNSKIKRMLLAVAQSWSHLMNTWDRKSILYTYP